MEFVATFFAGLAGVLIGAVLARRNQRQAHGDELLATALNDLVTAVAHAAEGDPEARQR